ncbi:MAG TPA: hypothetical protein VFP68_14645 [Burkholderiaceae bacterium]|nr:hypothetical protein [Burkholderiaceae bacterium]
MTLQQLSVVKQWHVAHRRERPVELHMWDAMLTLWLLGWFGIPAAVLLDQLYTVVLCGVLLYAPTLYVQLRRRLHAGGRLRCDWLVALRR